MKFQKPSLLSILSILLVQTGINAAELPATSIPKTGTSAEQFCPPGWKVESKLTAGLQSPATKDQILELVTKKPSKNTEGVPTDYRALLVIFDKSGKYELADYASKFLLCSNCEPAWRQY